MELLIIQNKIYEIRGQKVMLDFDLAEMYQVKTKVLNQSVKRNIQRFPSDFMFQLSKEEWENLMSQFVTSSWGGTRKLPHVFTEQGIAMLSGLLNSEVAIAVNISIMRAFVAVRQLILNPPASQVAELEKRMQKLQEYVEDVFADYNDINEETRIQLELINEALAELQVKNRGSNRERPVIGFKI